MKRIIKFMLLAAFVLPAWATLAAQNTVPPKNVTTDVPTEESQQTILDAEDVPTAFELASMAQMASGHDYTPYKAMKLRDITTNPSPRIVTKVTKTRANVPEGSSQITLIVLDTGDPGTGVWNDGTGYQMLLDANATAYGSIIPATGALTTGGDVSDAIYSEFEYKIPENADGALATENIVVSGSQSITIPAGTYDWCITNPTPTGYNARMWIAASGGEIQGRYDDFVFESGFAYTFTISYDSVSDNDQLAISITSNYENPTNLAVSNIYDSQAKLTWTAGGDENSWNVQYRKKEAAVFAWTNAGTATSTNYLLNGLDAATEYQARVQGVYADGGLSGWALVTFTTNNDPAPLCDPEDMGTITYTLNDSYGDGWNSAKITIKDAQTGTVIKTLTISSGSSATGTVSLCYGRDVNFVWTSGSFDSECSFTFTDPDGDEIVSGTGSSYSNNEVIATYTMQMPIKPSNLAVNNVTYKSATATWDGVTEVYNLRYRPAAGGEWVVVNNVTSPYVMTGLDSETQYEVQVQGVLDNFTSNWTASVTFTTLEGPTQSLDFGTVNAGSSKTMTAKIANDGNEAVTTTITIKPENSPFSVASTEVTLAANALTSIDVTFSPEEARNYNGTLTVSVNGENTIVTLTGVGYAEGPEAIRDEAFFAGISYKWPITTEANTSTLDSIATDPEQIIAMLRKVYMDQNIPGNYKRGSGYNEVNGKEAYNDVYYSGVGEISRRSGYSDYSSANAYYWDSTKDYGWKIPGTIGKCGIGSGQNRNWYYASMDTTQYKPYQEGLTLVLLEVVDNIQDVTINSSISDPYLQLKEYISKTIKSARIVTQAKRVGTGDDKGTLFKIDCNKMNKFYLIAKGQLRWLHESYMAQYTYNGTTYAIRSDFSAPPSYIYNSSRLDQFVDRFSREPFYHMFEQFSPSSDKAGDQALDLYSHLIAMETFPVIHDCMGVAPVMGHQFQMYGVDSGSDDCQDVRDLMFFVPDNRMTYYCYDANVNGKDTTLCRDAYYANSGSDSRQKFRNYNPAHAPMMGLFVIKQYPITGEQIDGQETYKLHLTWTSNLLDYLPGEQGLYTLYRVITNPNGTKTYEAVGEFDPNTFEYYDNVPMQHNGQQVTYVVEGQDVGKFLSLQMSNEESFIIPGLDRAEQIRIELNNDYYFSRYDAAEQKNYYSNSLIANNTVGTNVKPYYIENGSQFKFWRATIDVTTGELITPEEPFVVAEVSNWNATTGGTLTYKNWNDQADFSTKPYKHGYHANVATSTISIDDKDDQITTNDEVVFDGLKLYDNFSVAITEDNDHPVQYVYYVTLETAVPFGLNQSIPSSATWQEDKIFAYFEAPYSDWYEVRAYAWNGDDLFAGDWAGTDMDHIDTYNNKKVYRWSIRARDNGALPANIIFSWKDGYHNFHQTGNLEFSNGGYYTITDVNNNTGSLVATTSAENTSNQARSNTVTVPVYKTEMTMKPLSKEVVDGDVEHSVPASTKFDVNTRYSSKSEILGYYIYRWADGKTAANARSIYESNGDDSSPQGQAGNQSEYYSVAMNTDFTGRTENFEDNDYEDVTASFEDNYMVGEAKDADTYTYAPVVELFAPPTAVNLNDNSDRTDYNTYGGPQQMTAGGVVKLTEPTEIEASEYTFTETADGRTGEFAYYTIPLGVTVDVPAGFDIYKVRAWRQVDVNYLGEEQNSAYTGRVKADYLFETNDNTNAVDLTQVGETPDGTQHGATVKTGTFGAKKVTGNDSFDANFIVRVYFTRNENLNTGSKAGEPDGNYYIAEAKATVEVKDVIYTAVNDVNSMKQVVSVKYYNVAGIESDKPFDGVNIVVTRYSDGSTATQKMMK